jgi:hypothetical protein
LTKTLEMLREDDTLVVWKLDRLGRSVKQLVDLVGDLHKQGIQFRSLTDSIDTGTPSGRFFFHVMASLAEMERELVAATLPGRSSGASQFPAWKSGKSGKPSLRARKTFPGKSPAENFRAREKAAGQGRTGGFGFVVLLKFFQYEGRFPDSSVYSYCGIIAAIPRAASRLTAA